MEAALNATNTHGTAKSDGVECAGDKGMPNRLGLLRTRDRLRFIHHAAINDFAANRVAAMNGRYSRYVGQAFPPAASVFRRLEGLPHGFIPTARTHGS